MVVTTNDTAEIKRPENGAFVLVASGLSVFIEPATAEIMAIYDDGVPGGQLFSVFMEYMDADIGDKLVCSRGEYMVRGVKKFDSFLGEHSELVVRKI